MMQHATQTVGLDDRPDIDWQQLDEVAIHQQLTQMGYAQVPALLSAAACDDLVAAYADESLYRSKIVMARHGFGLGEYKYFKAPLPDTVQRLRTGLYPHLVSLANEWNVAMGIDVRYPALLDDFLARCHEAGQCRATPLILKYGPGDYNCLHQDLYGEHAFPLQVAILLRQPQVDFTGGEFALTEQRPRMQSRVEVVGLNKGDAVVFAVHHRPVRGTRGIYRVQMRHGVSRLRSGSRYTLGIIFHDAT